MTTAPAAPASVSACDGSLQGPRTAVSASTVQAAMNAAAPGDVLVAPRGTTLPPLTVPPDKRGAWCVLMTDGEPNLSRPGTTVTADQAVAMVKTPGITATDGSGGWRFVGIEVPRPPVPDTVYVLINLARGSSRLRFERCYPHGTAGQPLRRSIALNNADTAVVDSLSTENHEPGADAQAICGWDGPGPFLIDNCELSASTENILFGGSDPSLAGLIPSDITIRRTRLSKDPAWGNLYPQKNKLEFKNARRVLVEDMDFVADGWRGVGIVITPRNQDGSAPWCGVTDLLIQNSRFHDLLALFSLQTTDDVHASMACARIAIRNLLGLNIQQRAFYWGSGVAGAILDDLEISHVTALPCRNSPFWPEGALGRRLTFTDNLFGAGSYAGQAVAALIAAAGSDGVLARNVLVDAGDEDGAGPDRNQGFTAAQFNSIHDPTGVGLDLSTGIGLSPTIGYQPTPIPTPAPAPPSPFTDAEVATLRNLAALIE